LQITTGMVKELREQTGAGVMDCRRALEQAEGDVAKAREVLAEQGLARAAKKSGRLASQGVVDAYIHAGGRIGVLVELNCETDFVGRNDDFRALAHDIAMQIAATGPQYVSPEDAPADLAEEERAQASLLTQAFIKNPSTTIQGLINQAIAKFGENVQVRRFSRFELGN
jgi:elongation factor Ts